MIYNNFDQNNIDIAVDLIQKGEIIIYSTDTLYGFGVDATNSKAIARLNKMKNRTQPYSIIVDSFSMLEKYAMIDSQLRAKLKNIFPGPYTAILKKINSNLSKLVTLDLSTVGIRIPNDRFILEVVKTTRKPIITTSVNMHTETPINKINEIKKIYNNYHIFTNNIDKSSKGSTIIDFTVSPYKLIREGDKSIQL